MKKSTIPEWAIARERFQLLSSDDELVQDMQFISYLLVFGSSVNYSELTPMERATADRLLRMGVLLELDGPSRMLMLTKPWKRAIELKRRKAS
jgi:hypothetical protein